MFTDYQTKSTTHLITLNADVVSVNRSIRIYLGFFLVGIIASGLTCIPVVWEMRFINMVLGEHGVIGSHFPSIGQFITHVYVGVQLIQREYSFMMYGLNWLGFAHFAIALVFVGAWKSPLRNQWVIEYGLLVCLLAIPAIFIFGYINRMPLFWSFVDTMFPVFASVPLYLAYLKVQNLNSLYEISYASRHIKTDSDTEAGQREMESVSDTSTKGESYRKFSSADHEHLYRR